jgi:hypothetical protein
MLKAVREALKERLALRELPERWKLARTSGRKIPNLARA